MAYVKGSIKMGRPKLDTFSDEEIEKLGEEMIEWVIENNPLHLSEWYTITKMITYKEWKQLLDSRPNFSPYYEVAQRLVSKQYLDKDSRIRDSISQRWQRVYFKDLRDDEDETAKFNSELKTKENNEKANLADLAISLTESIKKNYELKKEQDNK